MKILITGAKGQLGNEIKSVQHKYSGYNFIFTDIDELDLTRADDVENYIKNLTPDFIVNCAAYTAVDKAESDSDNAELINAKAPEILAKLATKYNVKLIHISTDYVFSGKTYKPLNEGDVTQPESVYGKTKLKGEQLVLDNNDAIIIRTSWLYSVHGNNFVKSMLRMGKEKEHLGIVFDQTGSPTCACDLAKAILHIIVYTNTTANWPGGIYHYSNEGVCTWYDFAYEIMKMSRLACKINPIETKDYPSPAMRPPYSVMNKQKIKDTFKLSIPYWKDSLSEVVKYLLKSE